MIRSIILAFIISAGLGACVSQVPKYSTEDPFKDFNTDSSQELYPQLNVCLLQTENARISLKELADYTAFGMAKSVRYGKYLVEELNPKRVVADIKRVLDSRFGEVVVADVPAGCSLIVSLDLKINLPRMNPPGITSVALGAALEDGERRGVDLISTSAEHKMGLFDTELNFREPWSKVVKTLADRLDHSEKLAAYAARTNAPAAPAAGPTATAVRFDSDVEIPSFTTPERPDDFALVVGVEKYAGDIPEAQFAERDAQAMRRHLVALGFPERNIKSLIGNRASKGQLEAHLQDWLPKYVTAKSRVFFFFSGHGAPDPASRQAYLMTHDGDPKFLDRTAYPLKRLYADLDSLNAKQVIIALDSCFSGAGGRSVLPEGTRPLVSTIDTSLNVSAKTALFAATSPQEITSTLKDKGHGIFTYYFLKGLSGEAMNASGVITFKGLYSYLRPKVQDEASRQNREQTPVFEGPEGELIR